MYARHVLRLWLRNGAIVIALMVGLLHRNIVLAAMLQRIRLNFTTTNQEWMDCQASVKIALRYTG